MISICNARDMDDGNKIKTLVYIIHATTTRKDTQEKKRTKHMAATSKTMHKDTNGVTKTLIDIICTAKLDAAIDYIENAQMTVMDLINILNTTNDCNKARTLIDVIYAAETATPKTANSTTNRVEEAKSLSTIVNNMKKANSLDTVIDAMEDAYKMSRNLIAIIKAKEQYAISKDPNHRPSHHEAKEKWS